jgi:hypothetical protein
VIEIHHIYIHIYIYKCYSKEDDSNKDYFGNVIEEQKVVH